MSSIKIANAPCSWGVLEFNLEGNVAGYAQVLDEMCETGYAGTELGDWGFMPTDPQLLKQELARRSLALLGAFVPVAFAHDDDHDAGEAAALRTAQLLAAAAGPQAFIVLADDNGKDPVRTTNAGRITPLHNLGADARNRFACGVERVAKAVYDQTGLRTVFHHHCAGFIETAQEITFLLDHTDPHLVGLCLDTGHLAFAGGDPTEMLTKYGERIWHVHFKDCHPAVADESRSKQWDYFASVRHGIFCELGKGMVNFPKVVRALRDLDYKGWIVVEQDVLPGMGTPKECAYRNRVYLQTLGL